MDIEKLAEGLAYLERRLALVEETTLNVRLERRVEELQAEVKSLEHFRECFREIEAAFGLEPGQRRTHVQTVVKNAVSDMRQALMHLGAPVPDAVGLSFALKYACEKVEWERELEAKKRAET